MKKIMHHFIAILFLATVAGTTQAQVSVSIRIGPPMLPVYEQPYCPGDGFMWTPGYWAYGDNGYFWVPGTWILPPQNGFYWTPGYWAFTGGYYGWHTGYWGQHIGYYGGINYGFGYGGRGYYGGEWSGSSFRYNTAVTRVNTTVVHNVYVNNTVVSNTTNNTTIVNNRSSFNGQGGVAAAPSSQEQAFAAERHVQPTQVQMAHEATARTDKSQFASANHGHPGQLAVAQPKTARALSNQNANPRTQHQQDPGMMKAQHNANMQQRQPTHQNARVMRQPQQTAPRQQEHSNGGNGKERER